MISGQMANKVKNKPAAPVPSSQWAQTHIRNNRSVCNTCWCEAPNNTTHVWDKQMYHPVGWVDMSHH